MQSTKSFSARCVFFFLRLVKSLGLLRLLSASKPPRSKQPFVQAKLFKRYSLNAWQVHNREVATFALQTWSAANTRHAPVHVLYLHGGAFVLEAFPQHWKVLKRLLQQDSCQRVTFPDYPLAPESNHMATLSMVVDCYQSLRKKYPSDKVVLMGDSAGGGLVLSLLQLIAKTPELGKPYKSVLFSPWVDLTLSNPDIVQLVDNDFMLTLPFLRNAAEAYAGSTNLADPLVSPLNGEMNDLGEIALFYGTDELFLPDCRLLADKINSAEGSHAVVYEYEGMQHVWVAMPIKEAVDALHDIDRFLDFRQIYKPNF